MHQSSGSSGVVRFHRPDVSVFLSAIGLSPAVFLCCCVGCSPTRKRALQAHPHKLLEALRQLFELHSDFLLHLLRDRQVAPDGKSCGVRRQSESRQRCTSVQPTTSRPKRPAARCRYRGSKQHGITFEPTRSFTVGPSVKTAISTRNRQGDVMPDAGPLHLVGCVYLNCCTTPLSTYCSPNSRTAQPQAPELRAHAGDGPVKERLQPDAVTPEAPDGLVLREVVEACHLDSPHRNEAVHLNEEFVQTAGAVAISAGSKQLSSFLMAFASFTLNTRMSRDATNSDVRPSLTSKVMISRYFLTISSVNKVLAVSCTTSVIST